jgi:flagellar biosynthetic protein FlhB
MAEQNDEASKTEDATPKKLEDARKKGDVAKTHDVPPLLALAAAFSVLAVAGAPLGRQMASGMLPFIARPHEIAVDGEGGIEVLRQAGSAAGPTLLAVLCAAMVAGVFGNVIQHGFLWTTDKLKPDPQKVSPMAGFKRIFGLDGQVAFGKSLLKIVAVAAVTWWVLRPRVTQLTEMSALDPAAILPVSFDILKALFIAVISLMAVTAGVDWVWQRFRFMERMRMSKEELKQEYKTTEGDPLIKAKLRQMRIEKSRRRMIQNVPKAAVVIMNPTHYAVALSYEMGQAEPPKCVAKGLDALALKIREVAEANGVAVIEDPPLARALYASIDVDEVIPTGHYEAVAKIIGFVMGKKSQPGARPLRAGAL